MTRAKQTARKSTCGYIPPRVVEHALEARNPDAYQDWKDRRREERILRPQAEEEQQQESQEEEPEEFEPSESGHSQEESAD